MFERGNIGFQNSVKVINKVVPTWSWVMVQIHGIGYWLNGHISRSQFLVWTLELKLLLGTSKWLGIKATQQDYYGRRCGTLLHSYCTSTYTEVTVLLLWSSSNATLEYPHRYSNRVVVWVLHGNSRITSQEQHGYFSVGTSAVTV